MQSKAKDMDMTKKDYILIAYTLKTTKPDDANRRSQWEMDVRSIATALGSDNRRFNRDKFLMYADLVEAVPYAINDGINSADNKDNGK
jgi:hypothetical protein